MWALVFLAGVATSVAARAILKPLVRETIKGGIIAAREVSKAIEEARADLEDAVAEASAAVDREEARE
jgi:hypothetical protein